MFSAFFWAILLFLLPIKAQFYGYGRMGFMMSPSMDGPISSAYANSGNPTNWGGYSSQQQIHFLRERVDQLEKEVYTLRRIAMHDWNSTESGSLYKVFSIPKTWREAESACKSYGAKLASIDSDEKNNYVRELVQHDMGDIGIVDGFGDMEVWIGLKAKAEMTSSGTSSVGGNSRFTNFADDERIDGCAVMDSKGKWKIRPCSQYHPFVCQQVNL